MNLSIFIASDCKNCWPNFYSFFENSHSFIKYLITFFTDCPDASRDDLNNENSSDEEKGHDTSDQIKPKPKVVKRRVFTVNLTNEDLTCSVCNRTFSAMYKLRIHKLIHSKTPPFVCSHCGRGFNNKYKMRGHERRHCSSIGL